MFRTSIKLIRTILLSFVIINCQTVSAQWMMINQNGGSPDPTAALEIQSTDRGLLISRMTEAERDAIVNPEQGLLLYQTNQDSGFYFRKGNKWEALSGSSNTIVSTEVFVPDESQPIPIAFDGDTIYVHPTVNDISIRFYPPGTSVVNDWSDGESNTANLVALHGQNARAANLCETLTAFGFSDWYLPSANELSSILLHANLFSDGFGDGVSNLLIWSSTLRTTSRAYYFSINPINIGTADIKDNTGQCWCVRK